MCHRGVIIICDNTSVISDLCMDLSPVTSKDVVSAACIFVMLFFPFVALTCFSVDSSPLFRSRSFISRCGWRKGIGERRQTKTKQTLQTETESKN